MRATKQKTSDLEEVRQSFRYYTDNSDEIFSKIHWVEVDFQDLESLEMALSGVREVYHCAGKVSFDSRDRDKIYKTNVEGTKKSIVCLPRFIGGKIPICEFSGVIGWYQ